jgi:hypothetical protein
MTDGHAGCATAGLLAVDIVLQGAKPCGQQTASCPGPLTLSTAAAAAAGLPTGLWATTPPSTPESRLLAGRVPINLQT